MHSLPYIALAAAALAADQWVKHYVTTNLILGGTQALIPGFVELQLVHNYGAAWSSFSGMRWLLVLVTSAIVAAVRPRGWRTIRRAAR